MFCSLSYIINELFSENVSFDIAWDNFIIFEKKYLYLINRQVYHLHICIVNLVNWIQDYNLFFWSQFSFFMAGNQFSIGLPNLKWNTTVFFFLPKGDSFVYVWQSGDILGLDTLLQNLFLFLFGGKISCLNMCAQICWIRHCHVQRGRHTCCCGERGRWRWSWTSWWGFVLSVGLGICWLLHDVCTAEPGSVIKQWLW